jgi:hypothetical protein
MYSFPGANHNLRRKRVRERTKLYNISAIVMVFSLSLAQQAQAGSISISNRNCAWQGLSRTNEAKFRISGITPGANCSGGWITLHVGRTQTLQVMTSVLDRHRQNLACNYLVQPEGNFLSLDGVSGKDISKYVCELDWIGICQCRKE